VPYAFVLVLALACDIERGGTGLGPDGVDAAPGMDGGRRDAALTKDSGSGEDAPPIDVGPPAEDAFVIEVDAFVPEVDAGPRLPTAVIDLATSTTNGGHPAVIWTGTDFVVAYLVGDGSGTRAAFVEIAHFAPGSATGTGVMRLTPSAIPRDSLTLASSGGGLAVAWIEDEGSGMWQLDGTVIGAPAGVTLPMHPNVLDREDRDDAHVFFDGGLLTAVVRIAPAGGGEHLVALTGASSTPIFVATAAGEVSGGPPGGLPLLSIAAGATVMQRRGGTWSIAAMLPLAASIEGDAAYLDDGSLVAVYVDDPPMTRSLSFARFTRPGATYVPDGLPVDTGLPPGPDPAIDTVEDRTIVIWDAGSAPDRPLGIAALDDAGAVVTGPCLVAPVSGRVSNDPDLACGGGWCLAVWLEADDYDATDFETRLLQVPVEPELVCP
jgi:hypothetical protein